MTAKTVMLALALLTIGGTGASARPAPAPAEAARPATLALPDMPLHDPWIVAEDRKSVV